MSSRHGGDVPPRRRTSDGLLAARRLSSASRQRPPPQRRLVSPPSNASVAHRPSSSIMEVDEKKRQTSIQEYFFVKASGTATSPRKMRANGGGGGNGGENARRMPLRALNPNGSEDSNHTDSRNGAKHEAAMETDERGLPNSSVEDHVGGKGGDDGRRLSMREYGEAREDEGRSGHSNSCAPHCFSDRTVATQPAEGVGCVPPIPPRRKAAKRQYQQLFLDFGQRDFAKQQFCGLCGMMVVHGVEEDIRQHEKICRAYRLGVPFQCDTARAVAHPRQDSVIYHIRPGDGAALRKKVDQVRAIVDKELGFVVNPSNTDSLSTFLYARDKRVIGLCSVLPIQRGYVLAASNLERSSEPRKATIGVHQIWVHSQFRTLGVATALVDAARERLIFGMVVPAGRVAFSSPSEAGASFARRYAHKASGLTEVLVYDAR